MKVFCWSDQNPGRSCSQMHRRWKVFYYKLGYVDRWSYLNSTILTYSGTYICYLHLLMITHTYLCCDSLSLALNLMPFTYAVLLDVSRTCLWTHRPWRPTAIQLAAEKAAAKVQRFQRLAGGCWSCSVFTDFLAAGSLSKNFLSQVLFSGKISSWTEAKLPGWKNCVRYHWLVTFYHILSLGDVELYLTDSCKNHLTIHPKCLTTSRHCRDPINFKSNVLQRHCGDRGPMTRQGTWNLQCVFSSDLTVDSVSLDILMCSTVLEAWVGNWMELVGTWSASEF